MGGGISPALPLDRVLDEAAVALPTDGPAGRGEGATSATGARELAATCGPSIKGNEGGASGSRPPSSIVGLASESRPFIVDRVGPRETVRAGYQSGRCRQARDVGGQVVFYLYVGPTCLPDELLFTGSRGQHCRVEVALEMNM